MNLTLQEVRDRIDWLLANTTVMPTARTNVADIDLVNGVGREAHFVTVDRDELSHEDLRRQVGELQEKIEGLQRDLDDTTPGIYADK